MRSTIAFCTSTAQRTASTTLAYFEKQGVEVKVISGDHPETVAAVARRVGLSGAETPFDAKALPEDREQLAEVLDTHSIFGRVTPHQKRSMVEALQSQGHVVAMTGDGVNDVLALKDADIGIAMGSGTDVARECAGIVLIGDDLLRLVETVRIARRCRGLISANFAGNAVSRQIIGSAGSRCASATLMPSAVCGSTRTP